MVFGSLFVITAYSKLLTGDSPPDVGNEYSYVEEWGEQMVSKSQPVVVTLNLVTFAFYKSSNPVL